MRSLLLQSANEPSGAATGKSVCHLRCQSGVSACTVEADGEALARGLAVVPLARGLLAVPGLAADELQAHRASVAAASQASLVMVGPHRRLSGTPSPPRLR
jgi:hypothetical protein